MCQAKMGSKRTAEIRRERNYTGLRRIFSRGQLLYLLQQNDDDGEGSSGVSEVNDHAQRVRVTIAFTQASRLTPQKGATGTITRPGITRNPSLEPENTKRCAGSCAYSHYIGGDTVMKHTFSLETDAFRTRSIHPCSQS